MRADREFRGLGTGGWGPGARGQRSESDLHPSSFILHPSRPPSAFTLVELLVVIVIISMMVGLLLPALISARGRARIATCSNNQHELSLAITQYDIAKKRLPGYANRVGGNKVSWIPVLFPFLGRMDLWEGDSGASMPGWRTGNPALEMMTVRINQLVCPDDSQMGPDTPLSYVLNVGLAITDDSTNPINQNGVFRNRYNYPTKTISMSSITSPSQRPMLSERTYPVTTTIANRQWSDIYTGGGTDTLVTGERLGFRFFYSPPPLDDSVLITLPFLPPLPLSQTIIHPGIVIITFCDGHTESVADNAQYNAYDYSAVK